jgi:hypothetical protein
MATWKKVIVSGSNAELAALKVDNLTSGQVVIGGGAAGNLSTTAINGTGNIVATSNASGLTHSGSFSGSFSGDGSGLSGVAASFPIVYKGDLASTDKFFINDGASKFVSYSALLTDIAGTNLTADTDSINLSTTITGITSISSTSFTGSLFGTSSWASNAISSSYSLSASFAMSASEAWEAVSASFATNAANATSASIAANAVTASRALSANTASYANFAISSSITNNAVTASRALNANTASFATSAASATSASFATSAANATSASYSTFSATASIAQTLTPGTTVSASNVFVTNNLTVNGTASFNYLQTISGSAVVIGEEFIILNTQSPAARFAGLQIYDSGSNATASIVWDSQRNHFVYQNASGSSYNGGGFISGPRNTGSLGDEPYPTLNRIVRGQGGDHIYDSNITDNDTNIILGINTQITGTLGVTGTITGNLTGTASFATSASYAGNASNATSASFATSAANATSASFATSAANATSASFATNAANAVTASYVLNAISSSISAVAVTASHALNAVTASRALSANTASYANFAISSSITDNAVTASRALNANTASFATSAASATSASFATSAANATSASYATFAATASFVTNAGQTAQSLTFGVGLSGSAASFNGAAAVNVAISGSATLTTNRLPKWTGTGLANSNITDTGTQVQIGSGATSGVTIAAGGINVTGNSTFNNNVTIAGDLAVNGTTTFINTTNTYVKDQFVLIASGSTSLVDAGIVAQYNAAGSGSTFYLDAAPGTYGRWAVAYDVVGTSTAVTADEFVVTAKINQASNPSAAPTWGGSGNGSGNIWVTNGGDIFIYA